MENLDHFQVNGLKCLDSIVKAKMKNVVKVCLPGYTSHIIITSGVLFVTHPIINAITSTARLDSFLEIHNARDLGFW